MSFEKTVKTYCPVSKLAMLLARRALFPLLNNSEMMYHPENKRPGKRENSPVQRKQREAWRATVYCE